MCVSRETQAQRITALAPTRPYVIYVGGTGGETLSTLRGRVLEFVRTTAVYGRTEDLVHDQKLRAQLDKWPIAVVLSEVYSIMDEPRVIQDLEFPDQTFLEGSYGNVVVDENLIEHLWDALKDWTIERRWQLRCP